MIYVQNTVLAATGAERWSTNELETTLRFCTHFGNHSRVHMNAHLNEVTDPSNSKTVLTVLKEKRFATPV